MQLAPNTSKILNKLDLKLFTNFYIFLFKWYYFIARLHSFMRVVSIFFIPAFLPFITRNTTSLLTHKNLEKKIKAVVRFKKRNLFLPDINRVQVRAAFGFVKKQLRKKKYSTIYPSTNFLWNKNTIKTLKNTSPRKLKNRRAFFFRKRFTSAKRNYFLSTKFLISGIKPRKKNVLKLLSKFKGKSYKQIGMLLTLNPIKLLNRVFPFFDRFFILRLIKFGFFFVNFTKIIQHRTLLKVGDFISIVSIKRFNLFYASWLKKQRFYLRFLYKNLFQYFRSRFSKPKTKNYLKVTTLYNNLYKPLPT